MPGPGRRAPWPFSMLLDDAGYMLLPPERGAPLVARNQIALSDTPTNPKYSVERPVTTYDTLSGGFGLLQQHDDQGGRYSHALNVDASTDIWQVGPEITEVTPTTADTTNGISHFFELGSTLYALNGRYCLARSSDSTWIVGGTGKDFGPGKAAVDVLVYYSNADTAASALVAIGDASGDYIWRLRSDTWTQHASLQALAFARSGRDLYRAHSTNLVAKVDVNADPWTAANWGSAESFRAGEKNSAVVRMATNVNGTLLIFKTDGIYSLIPVGQDNAGDDIEIYPFLRLVPDSYNGRAFAPWGDDLYVTYAQQTARIDPANGRTPVGPELIRTNASAVRGHVTAMCGTDYALYALIYNVDDDASYLMKFEDKWREEDGARVPIWHGSLTAAFSGKKGTAMHRSTIGASTGHSRLYMGFDDGSIAYYQLSCVPQPVACSAFRWSVAAGYLHFPRWYGGYLNESKDLAAYTVANNNLSGGSRYAQMGYKTDPTAADFTALSYTFSTAQRDRARFPNGVAATTLDQRMTLGNNATTTTPQVTGLALEFTVRPAPRFSYDLIVSAADNLVARDGRRLMQGQDEIRDALKALDDPATQSGAVELLLPDDEDYVRHVTVKYLGETTGWDDRLGRPVQAIAIRCVEQSIENVYGTHERLMQHTHEVLMKYQHAQLQAL